jgi:hypothetical protein
VVEGIDQAGCVYTAQGFKFDYVGVIVVPELVYRPLEGWVGQREELQDRVVRRGVSQVEFTAFALELLERHVLDAETEETRRAFGLVRER